MRKVFVVLAMALTQAACFTSVSENEQCVETRYGKVINERMSSGLNATVFTDAVCFPLTDQNYGPIDFSAMAKDSILVSGKFAWVWSHNPAEIVKLYRAKGNAEAAVAELEQGALTGLQNAIAQFRSDDLYSQPEKVDAALRAAIDRTQQGRALTKRSFVRSVLPPQPILVARQQVQQKDLALKAAQRQLAVDSMNGRGKVIAATATAEAKRLEAQSYAANPQLLQLEAAKAMANGLSGACKGVQTCILGGSVMDAWKGGVR